MLTPSALDGRRPLGRAAALYVNERRFAPCSPPLYDSPNAATSHAGRMPAIYTTLLPMTLSCCRHDAHSRRLRLSFAPLLSPATVNTLEYGYRCTSAPSVDDSRQPADALPKSCRLPRCFRLQRLAFDILPTERRHCHATRWLSGAI